MTTIIVEKYTRPDGWECSLFHNQAKGTWSVLMVTDEGEVHWHMIGTKEGGRYEGMRLVGATFVPYTEETARNEFERWRT